MNTLRILAIMAALALAGCGTVDPHEPTPTGATNNWGIYPWEESP